MLLLNEVKISIFSLFINFFIMFLLIEILASNINTMIRFSPSIFLIYLLNLIIKQISYIFLITRTPK